MMFWGVGPVVYAAGLSIRYFAGSNPVHPAIFTMHTAITLLFPPIREHKERIVLWATSESANTPALQAGFNRGGTDVVHQF